MPFVPKVPDSCANFDMDRVARVLREHRAYFPTAARELGVLPADLKRLTWARPHLLDEAHEEMELVVVRAWSEMIKALYSEDLRRQMWAADKILSSHLARDHPLAPARGFVSGRRAKHFATAGGDAREIRFCWRCDADDLRDAEAAGAERPRGDGKPVVSIGWGDGDKTIEHAACPEPGNKD